MIVDLAFKQVRCLFEPQREFPRVYRILKVWIHSIVWLDKRDKAYKSQAHCLMYTFTGLYEMYYPPWLPFRKPNSPLAVKTKCCMEEYLFAYHKSSWVTQYSLRCPNFLINCIGVSLSHHLNIYIEKS